jgi:surface polysaccharide O-acyltransferase-like enzyme
VYLIATFSPYFHLWFFALIIQLYLLYPLLARLHHRWRAVQGRLLLGCLVIQLLWLLGTVLTGPFVTAETFGAPASELHTLFVARFRVPEYLVYFMLGMSYGRQPADAGRRLAKLPAIGAATGFLAALALSAVTAWTWLNRFYHFTPLGDVNDDLLYTGATLTSSLVVVALWLWVSFRFFGGDDPVSRLFLALGDAAYGIYLVHMIFMQWIDRLLEAAGIHGDSWMFYPLLVVSTLAVSYGSVRILSAFPLIARLVGRSAPRRAGRGG